jgi:Recombination endonuclease VII
MQSVAIKACTKCGEDKSLSEYHAHKDTRDGKQSWCKECQRIHHKAVRYGLTYDEVRRREAGTCDACGSAFTSTRDCHFDHDHVTGVTRGTLCQGCNIALGAAGDSADRLMALAVYSLSWQ